jgi:hypothetical protein
MNPLAMTIDMNNVYWTLRDGTLRSAAKVNGAAATIAGPSGIAHGIAVDATSVYWTEYNAAPGAVQKVPLAGGMPTMIANDDYQPSCIAVDMSYAYWADTRSIQRVTLDGTKSEQVLDQQWYANAIAIDDANIYWGNTASATDLGIGLRRIAK